MTHLERRGRRTVILMAVGGVAVFVLWLMGALPN